LFPFPDPETTKLELAKAGSYMLVVGKDIFKNGQIIIVVPASSILPDEIADEGDRRKYLTGPQKNKVKAVKLRGELSNAIVLDDRPEFADIPIGQDISDQLKIIQWQPQVPAQLVGKVRATGNIDTAGRELSHHDCEQFLTNEKEFDTEENVIVTEKLHGSQIWLCRTVTGKELVSSKGIIKRGLVIEQDDNNTYWLAVKNCDPFLLMRALYPNSHVQVFGELIPCQS
jgi:RNA ligase (TIGR02306 family)